MRSTNIWLLTRIFQRRDSVGIQEMGYLFGQYRLLAGHFQGSLKGPRIFCCGSSLRTEVTGYGMVFFAQLIPAESRPE
ncbi:uncharacterized protein LOC116106029 isoform X4 [Pistacia vera]|uniref:uncharacterized protein LOC116106029 isoform X4 n=1 Tax=Pistacia vera TaxID=55513 RepID=UPI00126399EA|nr:uncharacterized protein LOC116106029 isoform X4 [Pistacia vera]